MIKRGLNSRLAEVGKIKIGGKGETRNGSKGPYQLPVRYDHFVITTTARGDDGNFIPDMDLMEKLQPRELWKDGQEFPKPMEVPIVFLYDDIDLNFNTSFANYQGAKCFCRGDGEVADRTPIKIGKQKVLSGMDDTGKHIFNKMEIKAGEKIKVECNPETCPYMQPNDKGATQCKPSGILSCLIPATLQIGGVYRFRSHSWNTISNILASLELIKTITGGILVGLPMKLQLIKKATEGHGNVNTVNVVFDGTGQEEMRKLAFIENKNRADHGVNMLQIEDNARKRGFTVDLDDATDVYAEFYTEPEPEKEKIIDITGRSGAVLDKQTGGGVINSGGFMDNGIILGDKSGEETVIVKPINESDITTDEKGKKTVSIIIPNTAEPGENSGPGLSGIPDDDLELF